MHAIKPISMISQKLGILYPIIQAPMAGVSTPSLAASVSNAGGLGMLGLGSSSVEKATKMILETRKLTNKPFGINVFCHKPATRDSAREDQWLNFLKPLFEVSGSKKPMEIREPYKTFLQDPYMLETILKLKPSVVTFHFGVPSPETIKKLRDIGIYTMCTATNLQEALIIQDSGIDAIVAQGVEAGGHRGVFDSKAKDEQWSTIVLVKMLSKRTKLPIVAAGGIMDGDMAKAVMNCGADAVQLGTAYILCPESAADRGYREVLKSSRNQTTQLTSALSGHPARGITNRLIEYCSKPNTPFIPDYPVAYDASKRLHSAERAGRYEYAAHWAGQGAPLARELGASELTETIAKEMGY